ncbi:hypothetical protein BGZ95_009312 [Linnemannia exigua]|uniref:Uncharacterized protein n=1 Tax=Linnemannia exigua TaxID=604196 RepID=A0AAD4DDC8_9FUNG|nr:hypothetical protein BGZ95_009312 [Linnemannia exigua]
MAFLGQLITALERYLVPKRQQGSLGTAATNTKSKTGSALTEILSAELIQSNNGIVYEILDECMSLGYPMMPSLAQLDLLVFGVPKSAS